MTKVRAWQTLLGLVVVCLFAAPPARAQSVAGAQLSGVVRDTSGAAVPGAEVQVTKVDTGQVRSVQSGLDGSYTFPDLPAGPYQLKVTLQGFNAYLQSGIVLQVSTNPVVNVTLTVGTLGETVTVIGNANMVETQSTGVGQVIDHQRVTELPLNGRQVTELIFLSGLAAPGSAGRPEHEQELPDHHDLGGRRPGQRHQLHHGRVDPQRSLQQPQPADALPGRDPGVQGRDERAAGPLRPSRGLHRQRGDAVGLEQGDGGRLRVPAELPVQRAQLLRARARQPEPQPVRRHRSAPPS